MQEKEPDVLAVLRIDAHHLGEDQVLGRGAEELEMAEATQGNRLDSCEPVGAQDHLRVGEQMGEVEAIGVEVRIRRFDRQPELVICLDRRHLDIRQDGIDIQRGAKGGRRVLVLDHADKAARKVNASGGGKCNFTNLNAEPSGYICRNPHFTRSALARFGPHEALELLRNHHIAYEEREDGRIFLLGSAEQVSKALLADCRAAGAKVRLNTRVDSASAIEGGGFSVQTSGGELLKCKKLVIAAGGKSWKSLGSTSIGYHLARQMGHTVTQLSPALVPFALKGKHIFSGLTGLALRARVSSADGMSFVGDVLVTHKGLSGPAILQISSYWREGQALELNLLPDEKDILGWLMANRTSSQELKTLLAKKIPKRLAHALALHLGGSVSLNTLTVERLKEIALFLSTFEITPSGTEGFTRAEVTLGGVDTNEVSSKTMESTLVGGLYFTGEVLDVTGWLGGYNLQWAWASAQAAGQVV